jgi:hypothetical protein
LPHCDCRHRTTTARMPSCGRSSSPSPSSLSEKWQPSFERKEAPTPGRPHEDGETAYWAAGGGCFLRAPGSLTRTRSDEDRHHRLSHHRSAPGAVPKQSVQHLLGLGPTPLVVLCDGSDHAHRRRSPVLAGVKHRSAGILGCSPRALFSVRACATIRPALGRAG